VIEGRGHVQRLFSKDLKKKFGFNTGLNSKTFSVVGS
jgi:hypothetical protein